MATKAARLIQRQSVHLVEPDARVDPPNSFGPNVSDSQLAQATLSSKCLRFSRLTNGDVLVTDRHTGCVVTTMSPGSFARTCLLAEQHVTSLACPREQVEHALRLANRSLCVVYSLQEDGQVLVCDRHSGQRISTMSAENLLRIHTPTGTR